MICKCGGIISNLVHKVSTERGASDWVKGDICKEDMPIEIHAYHCKSCGRYAYEVINIKNETIRRHNI